MLQTLEVAYGPQTAVVWLNRPDVRNALDPRMIAELTETFMALGADNEVRAIVLAGRGKAFCAGADLNWMRRSAQAGDAENRADAQTLATMLHTIYTCPKPTIARIHGPCMAGGMGLAAACDIAVASHEARFALTETRLGLIASMISPYVLRAMGARPASRWFLSAEVFEATEAWRIGLVHELCEADRLDGQINELLGSFMLTSPHAVAQAKRLIRDVAGAPIDAALLEETAARIAEQRASADGREGLASFLEKRQPAWVPRQDT
ncbi:enoyl-CoA hydratase/isomerase family protein [Bordetella pertussis]|uniref:enoyl-CoA hydratase/isomerase family protein n=1 Tax=Bordetella pertussis TaxID=520 RepID=UPI0005E44E3E|nr:enoyl-CoA hydratase/isomerase family protein [Bordetella pertussis]CPK72950.1 enoyl-CoA hydratase/isomerase [Bordetella pertussis]CPL65934.1 enoyl-CoA hydratase/isomerase [Bordetella pertussis]CPO90540.1 enoyl-CoA hydratase/isomerase [Bordetella pertussis]